MRKVILTVILFLASTSTMFAQTYIMIPPYVAIVDKPTITIAGATADTTATPSTGANRMDVSWVFGTVSGTYTTCTVQAKTSIDGTNYLTFGSAATVTVTTGTKNFWSIYGVIGNTTTVTTGAVSTTVSLSIGASTYFTFACSGAYGTSAPVTVSVIYR